MHEASIACEIYRVAQAAVEGQGAGRIESVEVRIGELAGVEPDLLRFAWEAVADEGVRLDIDWRQARQLCPACGQQERPARGGWLRLCEDCGMPLDIWGGDELEVRRISFLAEDDEEA